MTLLDEILGREESGTCYPREETLLEHIEEMLGGEVDLCSKPKTLLEDILDIFKDEE